MIVGNGDIASVLKDREDRIYFASGVSNSQEDRESEYRREVELLLSQDKKRHLVYFSSLSIFYSDTRYAQHKRQMEKLIRGNFSHWSIVRIGNITWGVNPHTLINHLINQKRLGQELEIRDVNRYLVNEEEFLYWVSLIPEWNCEMNIPGRRMKVAEIVKEYVRGAA